MTTKAERTRAVTIGTLTAGVVASTVLLALEPGDGAERLLGLVAVAALVAFDVRADGRLARWAWFVPLLAMLDVADVFWNPTRGTALQGAVIGALTALMAVGLAVVYRANRIINFAQGDLGAVPAVFVLLLVAKDAPGGAPHWMTGLPYGVAFALGILAAVFVGFVVERTIINRFCRSPRLVLTVATIGLAQLLTAVTLFMPGWFGLDALQIPTLDPPFEQTVEVGGVNFDENWIMVMVTVPVVLVALALFLRYTRIGIAVRAVAERADRASTLGVPVGRVQSTVWVIVTVFAFITIFLRTGVANFPVGSALGTSVLIPALAAAVIGRMENFARIAGAAIGLGVVEQAIVIDTGRRVEVFPVLFLFIIAGLALNRRRRASRVADQAVSTWQAAPEMRPIPHGLRRLPEVRWPRIALFVAIGVFVVTLPLWMSNARLSIATATLIISVVAVSLVVLTGWAGHVSLGQLAFAGVGAAVAVYLTQEIELVFFWVLLVAGLVGALVAVAVGLPAVRAGGLTFAVTTIALTSPVAYWLLNPEFFDWVPRSRFDKDPQLFPGVVIDSPRSFYFLSLAVLASAVAAALLMRRNRTGRLLIALRDNPRGAEAYGVNAVRSTLVGFAFSGFFAAVAGALFVHNQHFVNQNFGFANPFSPEESIRVFAIVVIGGLGSVPGAIVGAVYVFFVQYELPYEWRFLATGIGLLLVLLILPGGLGAGLAEARDGLLRFVARRRNLVVPSLVADRRVEEVPGSADLAAAIADATERPEIEAVVEMQQ